MATREIKTRFRLEGESEYRRAMKDAADATKVLNSEQKLAEAQFEATGDAQEYAAETARILKDQIREQEKAVQAAQQAVEKLKAAGVDPADKSMQQWNTRLNTAKTRLLNMQTQLNNTNSDLQTNKGKLDESKGSAEGFGDQLERIGKNIDFTATITAIDNVKEKIETLARVTVDAAQKIWSAETDAGKWADDLATAASKAGIDVETYQSWQYASQFIDTETSKITASITKLEKDLGSTSTEMAKSFNRLGVRTRETSGKVLDATDVFWDVIDALGRIEDPTQRSIYAQELLGASWKDLNPLIEAGSKAYKDLAEEGRQVAVVSEEDVEKLGKLNDAQTKMNAVWEKTKTEALAGLSPAFTEISTAVGEAGTALSDFLKSAEGQEALANLNAAVSGLLQSFLGDDNGAGTFKAIVDGASGAIRTFNGVLNWVKDNGEIVKGIVVGLAAAWTGLTVSKDVLSLLQLLQKVPLAKLTAVFGKNGAEETAKAATKTAAEAAKTAASGAGGTALKAAGSAAGVASNLAIGAGFAALVDRVATWIDKTATEQRYGDFNRAQSEMENLTAETGDNNIQKMQSLLTEFNSAYTDWENHTDMYTDSVKSLKDTFREHANEILEMLPDLKFWESARQFVGSQKDLEDGLSESEIDKIIRGMEWADDWADLGSDVVAGLANGIRDKQDQAESAASDVANATTEAAKDTLGVQSPSTVFEAIGENASIGLANGILARIDDVIAAAQSVAQAAADTLQSALEIRSPSRVMARLGAYVSQGFAEGIDRGVEGVRSAVSRMSGAAFSVPVSAATQGPRLAFAGAGQGAAAAGSAAAPGQSIHATILMDKKIVGYMVAPVVNEAIGAIVEEARA